MARGTTTERLSTAELSTAADVPTTVTEQISSAVTNLLTSASTTSLPLSTAMEIATTPIVTTAEPSTVAAQLTALSTAIDALTSGLDRISTTTAMSTMSDIEMEVTEVTTNALKTALSTARATQAQISSTTTPTTTSATTTGVTPSTTTTGVTPTTSTTTTGSAAPDNETENVNQEGGLPLGGKVAIGVISAAVIIGLVVFAYKQRHQKKRSEDEVVETGRGEELDDLVALKDGNFPQLLKAVQNKYRINFSLVSARKAQEHWRGVDGLGDLGLMCDKIHQEAIVELNQLAAANTSAAQYQSKLKQAQDKQTILSNVRKLIEPIIATGALHIRAMDLRLSTTDEENLAYALCELVLLQAEGMVEKAVAKYNSESSRRKGAITVKNFFTEVLKEDRLITPEGLEAKGYFFQLVEAELERAVQVFNEAGRDLCAKESALEGQRRLGHLSATRNLEDKKRQVQDEILAQEQLLAKVTSDILGMFEESPLQSALYDVATKGGGDQPTYDSATGGAASKGAAVRVWDHQQYDMGSKGAAAAGKESVRRSDDRAAAGDSWDHSLYSVGTGGRGNPMEEYLALMEKIKRDTDENYEEADEVYAVPGGAASTPTHIKECKFTFDESKGFDKAEFKSKKKAAEEIIGRIADLRTVLDLIGVHDEELQKLITSQAALLVQEDKMTRTGTGMMSNPMAMRRQFAELDERNGDLVFPDTKEYAHLNPSRKQYVSTTEARRGGRGDDDDITPAAPRVPTAARPAGAAHHLRRMPTAWEEEVEVDPSYATPVAFNPTYNVRAAAVSLEGPEPGESAESPPPVVPERPSQKGTLRRDEGAYTVPESTEERRPLVKGGGGTKGRPGSRPTKPATNPVLVVDPNTHETIF